MEVDKFEKLWEKVCEEAGYPVDIADRIVEARKEEKNGD